MKILGFTLLSFFLFFISTTPVVQWVTPVDVEMGDIPFKKEATVLFKFKNITDQPITISKVKPTCGCTAPTWSDIPVEPDSTGVIQVIYDADHSGYFRKKIKVYFNDQEEAERLYLEGFVE